MDVEIRKIIFNPLIEKTFFVFIGSIIIWGAIKVIRRVFSSKIKDTDSRYHTRKFIDFLGYISSIILFIVVFNNNLGKVNIAFGIAGAGIAFALQEVITSFAGWIAIVFGNYFRTGDRIQLNGIKGDVIDIGILRTTLMEMGEWIDADLYNGRVVRIANSFVFKEPVFNYSADFHFLWDEIKIPIQYGSDYKMAEQILNDASKEIAEMYVDEAHESWKKMVTKYMIEDASISPMVTLVIKENCAEFTLRYIVDYKKRRSTKNKLYHKILEGFEASGGKVNLTVNINYPVLTPSTKVPKI